MHEYLLWLEKKHYADSAACCVTMEQLSMDICHALSESNFGERLHYLRQIQGMVNTLKRICKLKQWSKPLSLIQVQFRSLKRKVRIAENMYGMD